MQNDDEVMRLVAQRGNQIAFAKALIDDFILALNAPDDVRAELVNYAKCHAEYERTKGRLS